MPLITRKAVLPHLRRKLSSMLVVDGVRGRGVWLFMQALELSVEGIVSKRVDSPYQSGVRSSAWIKIKRPGAVPPERFRHSRGARPPR